MNNDINNFFKQFVSKRRLSLIEEKIRYRTRYLTVVLEDIYQMHNASAIIRTCECFGIQDIHVIENKNTFNPCKEISVGAQQWVSLSRYENHKKPLQLLKDNGYRIIVTTSSKNNSTPLENLDLAKSKIAFVFGTELTGVSEEVYNQADEYINIPMYGFTESLNVSVSVGIILFYTTSLLYKSKIKWQMNENEIKELELLWLKNSVKKPELLEKHFVEQQNKNRVSY